VHAKIVRWYRSFSYALHRLPSPRRAPPTPRC
jgi:hypothetical protein